MTDGANLLKALHAIQEADAALVTQEPRIGDAVAHLREARQTILAEIRARDGAS